MFWCVFISSIVPHLPARWGSLDFSEVPPVLLPFSSSSSSSTASCRQQLALPDLNRERKSSVGTAGPQPREPDLSGHCRTSTVSARCQWALPNLNGERQMPDGMSEYTSDRMWDRMSECVSDKMPNRMPDRMPNGKECQIESQNICQPEFQTYNVKTCIIYNISWWGSLEEVKLLSCTYTAIPTMNNFGVHQWRRRENPKRNKHVHYCVRMCALC